MLTNAYKFLRFLCINIEFVKISEPLKVNDVIYKNIEDIVHVNTNFDFETKV